ncbi:MAG: quinolinate synthase NadA [Longimicrobiales bacterium]|nr:quinolinate synthase NadA [Longimicrobiales bacterium]
MSSAALEAETYEEMFGILRDRLADVVPEVELAAKAEVALEVNRLKKERGAVILGHNYMEPALYHSVCDFTGDSLQLSREAARTDGDPIVFCGVRFMAETAKILSPERTVLLPTPKGGCSLAESITAEDVRKLKERYPGVPVVTYVNTYAAVKAESDVCCTSSNAAKVVESLDSDVVIMLPDEFLAQNVARETGKRILFPSVGGNGGSGASVAPGAELGEPEDVDLDYQMIGWRGRCEVHDKFTTRDVADVRSQFPDVMVLAHPECSPDVVEAADFSGSTSAMIQAVQESKASRYLLLTECSMGDNIAAENPSKEMVRLCSVRCPHMNEITLEDTLEALRQNRYQIEVDEDVRVRALGALERMLEIG